MDQPKQGNVDPRKLRKHTRYRPDKNSSAKVQLFAVTSSFVPDASALVFEEAYGGCCLVMFSERSISLTDRWRVQIGSLHPMISEVVWVKRLDDSIYKVGLKFLE